MTAARIRFRPSRCAGALVAIAALVACGGRARAQSKEQCIASFDRGQELRDRMKLRAARDQFKVCVRDACPAPLRKDCAERLEDVTRDLPTIVLVARDAVGRDLSGVRVFIDAEWVALDESGRSIAIDPGQHTFRFERPPRAPVIEEVVIRMGERNRGIVATFANEPPRVAPEPPRTAENAPRVDGPSPWVYVAGGGALVGLAGFAYFAITGKNEKDRLLQSCAPACTPSEVDGVRNRYIAADISLGIGLASLAVAAYLLVSSSFARPTTATLSLAPLPHGGMGGAAVSF